MADTRLQQLAKTNRNPIEDTEYQNLLRASGSSGAAPAVSTDIASVLAKQKADQQTLTDRQNANEDALFNTFKTQSAGQEKLTGAYTRLAGEQGIPGLQGTVASVQGEITNVKGLIDRLSENITARTSGTLTNQAQKDRLIAAERTPLSDTLGRLATGLEPTSRALEVAQGNVGTQLQLLSADQSKELDPVKLQISSLSDRYSREITGFTTSNQNELTVILAKIASDQAVSTREWQAAQDLAKSEREWQQTKDKLAIESTNAIRLKQTLEPKAEVTGASSNPFLVGGAATTPVGGKTSADWNSLLNSSFLFDLSSPNSGGSARLTA